MPPMLTASSRCRSCGAPIGLVAVPAAGRADCWVHVATIAFSCRDETAGGWTATYAAPPPPPPIIGGEQVDQAATGARRRPAPGTRPPADGPSVGSDPATARGR